MYIDFTAIIIKIIVVSVGSYSCMDLIQLISAYNALSKTKLCKKHVAFKV